MAQQLENYFLNEIVHFLNEKFVVWNLRWYHKHTFEKHIRVIKQEKNARNSQYLERLQKYHFLNFNIHYMYICWKMY